MEVYPIDSKLYGLTYGEWSAKWWQWVHSIPAENNPITDTTGIECARGQNGPVWFLVGTYGGPVERACYYTSRQGHLYSNCKYTLFSSKS